MRRDVSGGSGLPSGVSGGFTARSGQNKGGFREEHDLVGVRRVPDAAYYGVQTLRALENFPITGVPLRRFPALIRAYGFVKQAAARANARLGLLSQEIAGAIDRACQEVIDNKLDEHFAIDVVQGGAGTSTNMNFNEVIANRALEILGRAKGEYEYVHPNDHVNMAQSTNDTYPTAVRLAILLSCQSLLDALVGLVGVLKAKAEEFSDVAKVARTQLQDAVPMTLGREFSAFAVSLEEERGRIREAANLLREINLGGTAIGTGVNASPDYARAVTAELSKISGIPLTLSPDLVEATSDAGAYVHFSSALRRACVKLTKICNDLRLLSSGPRAGLAEIELPAVQPGSTIMPGKVNPVIPEVVNQVAYYVMGNDLTVVMAAAGGQLQLNAFEPVIAFKILESMDVLTRALAVLKDKCVVGITANRERCRRYLDVSTGLATAFSPRIGYENAARAVRLALDTGRGVVEVLLEEGLVSPAEVDELLSAIISGHPVRTSPSLPSEETKSEGEC